MIGATSVPHVDRISSFIDRTLQLEVLLIGRQSRSDRTFAQLVPASRFNLIGRRRAKSEQLVPFVEVRIG